MVLRKRTEVRLYLEALSLMTTRNEKTRKKILLPKLTKRGEGPAG